MERLAAERGVALRDLSFAELDALWDAAKAELAGAAEADRRHGASAMAPRAPGLPPAATDEVTR